MICHFKELTKFGIEDFSWESQLVFSWVENQSHTQFGDKKNIMIQSIN